LTDEADSRGLTVTTYNLQHPAQFTAAAIDGLRSLFIAHLNATCTLRDSPPAAPIRSGRGQPVSARNWRR